MSALPDRPAGRAIGAIVFDLILICFVGLLVVNALGIRAGAALVPLLIGVPTLIVAGIILVLDLFPGLRRATGADEEVPHGLGALRGSEEDDEDLEVLMDPASRGRQAAFAAWIVGFVALAAFTSVYIAMPLALVAILLAVRLPLLQMAVIVSVTVVGFYLLFHHLLGVRL